MTFLSSKHLPTPNSSEASQVIAKLHEEVYNLMRRAQLGLYIDTTSLKIYVQSDTLVDHRLFVNRAIILINVSKPDRKQKYTL